MPPPRQPPTRPTAAGSDRHRQEWRQLGRSDPLWAVLSQSSRKYGSWEGDTDEFLRSGRLEVDEDLRFARGAIPELCPRRALDFGCGAGRTTRALARHARLSIGVDISEGMLARASEMSSRVTPSAGRSTFVLADARGLAPLADGSFDLVYSRYVLQHLPHHEAMAATLSQLGRLLEPAGVLVFQLPDRLPLRVRVQPRRTLYRLLRALGMGHDRLYWRLGLHPMRMRAVPRARVETWITAAGCRTAAVRRRADPEYGYRDALYVAQRTGL